MEINYHLQNERTNLIKDYNLEKRDLFNRNINLYFLHCCKIMKKEKTATLKREGKNARKTVEETRTKKTRKNEYANQ